MNKDIVGARPGKGNDIADLRGRVLGLWAVVTRSIEDATARHSQARQKTGNVRLHMTVSRKMNVKKREGFCGMRSFLEEDPRQRNRYDGTRTCFNVEVFGEMRRALFRFP
jgi:hypothetical protein